MARPGGQFGCSPLIAIDTNIFLYGFNSDCPEHQRASIVLTDLASSQDVVLCDLVLVELYILLRNPAVLSKPLSAAAAAQVCRRWRANPRWRIVESAPIMEQVWDLASYSEFGCRQIIDARLALTVLHHGVTTFVTRNASHFENFGFQRVWNPFKCGERSA